ncbi:EmrA/EmrK family multidrug efflux transporter periplasmic adaptor subunit [Pigmentiphaga sp. NML080357]|uniref:HlyD family secretion protein n=1 Tax=Pigmentiphaga sp. NML080357 TaxID=2008675 RepID=UPI000B409775|nr:efflux RND transporter periplasmic adaptor subunit [Pigmentiphaga sp. NML080357]OVZ64269.1 EmrA/EmrK family multidrug efflux transporter periplasmic adaptor subunit [Pigmentiphaga sp. NML080357]
METAQSAPNNSRKKLLLGAAGAFAVIAVAYGAWWALVARHYEHTDDAYVQGNLVQITPQIASTVVAIQADDTDYVKAGDPLVLLDKADAQVALDQAQAALAQTVRQVRTLYANNGALSANIAVRQAEVERARADLAKAQSDAKRRQELAESGAVSGEEMLHAQTAVSNAKSALASAQAALVAAREQLATNTALTDGTSVEQHPNVLGAAAKVREAYINLSRTSLPAPVTGYVAKRSAQVGQRVAPGASLMTIVPLDQVWVDANFKEVQLGRMRIGQPVTLEADVYGSKVEYHGKVAGLGAGTGSAFALLPAQNATGNWIKVVQRVPVRIALDPKEIETHPLRVGLSMNVSVDVSSTDGPALAEVSRTAPAYSTTVMDHAREDADALVAATIAQNLGGRAAEAKPAVAKAAPLHISTPARADKGGSVTVARHGAGAL